MWAPTRPVWEISFRRGSFSTSCRVMWVRSRNQDDHVGVAQAHGQLADPLHRVGEDLGGVGFQLGRALQLAHGVLVVVEDHDVHSLDCALRAAGKWLRCQRVLPEPRGSQNGPPPGGFPGS
jgi:hypothetical protein